jgi:hypothetical protein
MKTKLNREWHEANRMPKNPTIEQRLHWHVEHAKNCQCREMPEKIKAAMKKSRSTIKK